MRSAERRMEKAAALAMRAAVFRGAAGELRPVVEVPCGKIRGECAGRPLTWRRTCPGGARGACGAADGRTPGGRRRMIGAGVGASPNAWAGRIDEVGRGSFASAKLSAGGRTGGKARPAGCALRVRERRGNLCSVSGLFARTGSSDFFAALRLRRERLSGNAFSGAEARQRRSAAHRERFWAAEFSRNVLFCFSKKVPL